VVLFTAQGYHPPYVATWLCIERAAQPDLPVSLIVTDNLSRTLLKLIPNYAA
jgi:hypothetical protein